MPNIGELELVSRPSTEGRRLPMQFITIESPGYAAARSGKWNPPDAYVRHEAIVLGVLEDHTGDRWLRVVQWCGVTRRWRVESGYTPFAVVAWRADVESKPFLAVPTAREFPSVPFPPPPARDPRQYRTNPYVR
ncbi:MAG TPA: hypothetical protein VGN72_19810 [Tepidisphaeraceae bacterium]|jgi:hypothetical protein|nr:hypothetical protein [Tepidisphaeraceae bacterium]